MNSIFHKTLVNAYYWQVLVFLRHAQQQRQIFLNNDSLGSMCIYIGKIHENKKRIELQD